MVDSGANIVVCQHSHCIGAYENYKNACIIYGQGNVLFDYNDIEEWSKSILIQLDFTTTAIRTYVIPLEKNKEKVRICIDDAERVILDFKDRSEKIKSQDFLKEEFHRFNIRQKNIILYSGVMGRNNKVLLAINKILGGRLVERAFNEKHKLLLLNYIRCESIHESLMDLLNTEEVEEEYNE